MSVENGSFLTVGVIVLAFFGLLAYKAGLSQPKKGCAEGATIVNVGSINPTEVCDPGATVATQVMDAYKVLVTCHCPALHSDGGSP